MGLIIQDNGKGVMRPTWWGRITFQGKTHETNLCVPITGKPPVDERGKIALRLFGDDEFERSRKAAKKALDKWRKECQEDPAILQRKAFKVRTGANLGGTPLSGLAAAWRGISRTYTPTEHKLKFYDVTFSRFEQFARAYCDEWNAAHPNKRQARCETINDITVELARAWFNSIRAVDAWETVKNRMSLLSGAYTRFSTNGIPNLFKGIIKRNRENASRRVKREPLTQDQIKRVFDVSADDDFFHPLIVAAACTGMRIGDCCNLKWCDVDLRGGLIDVTTAKAGVRVTIPIFAPLRKVLDERATIPGDGESPPVFVFPEAARRYNYKTDKGVYSLQGVIFKGIKSYLGMAIDDGTTDATPALLDGNESTPPDPDKVVAAINAAPFTVEKTERLIAEYKLFADGKSYSAIAAELGTSKGVVSADLHDVERVTGRRIRPGATQNRFTKGGKTIDELAQSTRCERKNENGERFGTRQACLYGWHSFRTAFVTIAIDAGVPLAKVEQIVGHSSTRMTMDYVRGTRAHEAERVRKQMRGTVLDGSTENNRKAIGTTVDASADGTALAPVKDRAAAVRALGLARAVISADQAATVAAVIQAAGVDADAEPERALALIAATVDADTKAKIAAVIKAAGA